MNNSISAFDAKTHFSQILDRASKGEEILITKRGKAAAKIVPLDLNPNIDSAKLAAARIKKLAREINFKFSDWEELIEYKDMGKKPTLLRLSSQ